jgi:hypothetical protein
MSECECEIDKILTAMCKRPRPPVTDKTVFIARAHKKKRSHVIQIHNDVSMYIPPSFIVALTHDFRE